MKKNAVILFKLPQSKVNFNTLDVTFTTTITNTFKANTLLHFYLNTFFGVQKATRKLFKRSVTQLLAYLHIRNIDRHSTVR